MNHLTHRQQAMLDRGLSAFARASRLRRARRVAGGACFVLALGAIAALAASTAWRSPALELPAYVEIIASDQQLMGELELARACEQFERTDGRLRVQECVALAPSR